MRRRTVSGTPTQARGRRLLVPAVLGLAAAVGAVLYVMQAPSGKANAAACTEARAAATRLEPLVHGEIAALTLAKHPQPLPDLAFDGPDGAKTSLAAFKGREVLLNLWATWCVPCRQEMPALDRLQGALTPNEAAVVAVNIDTARLDRPKAFLAEIGVKNLAFYADNSADVFQALKRAGKVVGLPTTILVGRDGCEIGTIAGPAEWDSPEAKALLAAAAG
jgi:thiol-disulfide isomerase/thioredoxin